MSTMLMWSGARREWEVCCVVHVGADRDCGHDTRAGDTRACKHRFDPRRVRHGQPVPREVRVLGVLTSRRPDRSVIATPSDRTDRCTRTTRAAPNEPPPKPDSTRSPMPTSSIALNDPSAIVT